MLEINGKTIAIPPRTYVIPSLLAVQTHPKYWGPDPLVWRPARWIVQDQFLKPNAPIAEWLSSEELYVPLKGTYFPWSEGSQFCPGRKFAQVEFVAVMARLFRTHRVRPVLHQGESLESAKKRALNVCEDSEHVLLLRMKDGDTIRLQWEAAA
jgi:cytochrome P450